MHHSDTMYLCGSTVCNPVLRGNQLAGRLLLFQRQVELWAQVALSKLTAGADLTVVAR